MINGIRYNKKKGKKLKKTIVFVINKSDNFDS